MVENCAAGREKRVESDVDGLSAAKGRHSRCESLYERTGVESAERDVVWRPPSPSFFVSMRSKGRNIKGRPFWSRVLSVRLEPPTERNALDG